MIQLETSAVGTLYWLPIHTAQLQAMENCDGKAWEVAFLRSPKKYSDFLQTRQVFIANHQLNDFHS